MTNVLIFLGGACCGFLIAALCQAAKRDDEDCEEDTKEHSGLLEED